MRCVFVCAFVEVKKRPNNNSNNKIHRHTLKCDTENNTKKDDEASLEYAIESVN